MLLKSLKDTSILSYLKYHLTVDLKMSILINYYVVFMYSLIVPKVYYMIELKSKIKVKILNIHN